MKSFGRWLRAEPTRLPFFVVFFSVFGLLDIVVTWVGGTAQNPVYSAGMFAILLVLASSYYLGNDQ